MLTRLSPALAVAFTLLIAPAYAQVPTPTPVPTTTPTPVPTATPTPTPEPTDAQRRVIRDYRREGVIDACDHKRRTLKRVLKRLTPEDDAETPDLRLALEAAIEQHDDGDCVEPEPTPTPTPAPTAAPTVAPTVAPTPDDSPDAGAIVPPGGGGRGGDNPKKPRARDVKPLPEVTPVPPAATPAVPAEPSGPAGTPEPVYVNADDPLPLSLLVPAGLLALTALIALLLAAAGRLGWAEARLAGPRRAVREATFRAGGTWGDFADWIRVGR